MTPVQPQRTPILRFQKLGNWLQNGICHALDHTRDLLASCQEFNSADAKPLKAPSWQRRKKHTNFVEDLTETIIALDAQLTVRRLFFGGEAQQRTSSFVLV